MLAVTSVVAVNAIWAAVIAWAFIGLIALIIYRLRSARRAKRRSQAREETRAQEKLYAQFLNEHPELHSSLPKERHETFRRWMVSRSP